jgi:hypothetical protein
VTACYGLRRRSRLILRRRRSRRLEGWAAVPLCFETPRCARLLSMRAQKATPAGGAFWPNEANSQKRNDCGALIRAISTGFDLIVDHIVWLNPLREPRTVPIFELGLVCRAPTGVPSQRQR